MSSRLDGRNSLMGAAGAAVLVVVISCVVLLFRPHFFWNDDYQLAFLPAFSEMASALRAGEFPILTSASWVCSNLAGEYQYGVFSVFINACVIAVFGLHLPLHLTAAALSIIHLAVLSAGCFLLARFKGMGTPMALTAAVAASLNGWIILWAATNWFAGLSSFAWLPWAWWSFESAIRSRRYARWLLPSGLFLYLALTAGWPFTVLMLALVSAWIALREILQRNGAPIAYLAAAWIAGIAMAIPALMALLEYVHNSDRSGAGMAIQDQWIVPLTALPGLIFPLHISAWKVFMNLQRPHLALELATGFVPVVGLVAGLAATRLRVFARMRWELGLLLLTLALAMIPSVGVFRWSFRWLPLFHLLLAMAGCQMLDDIFRGRIQMKMSAGRVALLLAALGCLASAATGMTIGTMQLIGYLILIMLAILWLVWERQAPAISCWAPLGVCVLFFTTLYSTVAYNHLVPTLNLTDSLRKPDPLDPGRLYLSIYEPPQLSFDYWQTGPDFGRLIRPGNTPMLTNLRMINGYSPVNPAGVAVQFRNEGHGNFDADVVEKLITRGAGAGGALAQIGVNGLIFSKNFAPLARQLSPDWTQVYSDEEGAVYHRSGSDSRNARFVSDTGNGVVLASQNRRLSAEADVKTNTTDALLVFSRPFFPGYRASLNGQPLEIINFRSVAPAVTVPANTSGTVELVYRPAFLTVGVPVAVTAFAVTLLISMLAATQSRLKPPQSAE